MKTFEELRQSAQVLTREQMRMIVGGNSDNMLCSFTCKNGDRYESQEVESFEKLDELIDKKCGGDTKGTPAVCC